MKKRFTAVMMSVVLGVMSGAGAFAAEAPQVPEVISDEVQENEQELMDENVSEVPQEESEAPENVSGVPQNESEASQNESEAHEEVSEEQSLEQWLSENYSADGGVIGEDAESIKVSISQSPGLYNDDLIFDEESFLVPFFLPVTYDYGMAYEVLDLVNKIRTENGIAPLVWDSSLEYASCVRAVECAILFEHTRPNGYDWYTAHPDMNGENIAGGYYSAEAVVNAWKNSTNHLANILDPDFKTMTVSCVYVEDSEYGCYWSQNFSCGVGDDAYLEDGGIYDEEVAVEITGTEEARQVKNFVLRLYECVLGRKADYEGLADWFTDLICQVTSGAEAAYGFVFSEEFQKKNLDNSRYIDVLYKTMFNRAGDAGGKAAWLDNLQVGFSRLYVFRGFVESNEFSHLCEAYGLDRGSVPLTEPRDQNDGITRFVSRLYSKALNRTPDVGGLNAWTGQILSGQTTPEKVAFGFFFSDEMKSKKLTDEEYVRVLYRVFLDREADPAGLKSWIGCLKEGAKREAVMYGISKSPEFGEILKSYGLSQTKGELVYVTNSGTQYHKASCSLISGGSIPILIEDAKNIGYTPCRNCR